MLASRKIAIFRQRRVIAPSVLIRVMEKKINRIPEDQISNVKDNLLTSGVIQILSQPQLNHNSTQPNITKVGVDTKMTLHHHHPTIGNSTSAISILTKL